MRSVLFPAMAGLLLILSAPLQARDLPDFTKLVESNSPAVVNISTTQKVRHPQFRRLPKGPDSEGAPQAPFDELFKHFFPDEEGGGGEEQFDSQSLGSGFIISRDGYVLTNNHVIKDAKEVIVRLSDRRELTAEVVGTDERSDMALLKIDGKDLPVVKIGKSSELKVGEWVLAIGSPFGFDHSVTAGIVSAKGRSLPRENYVPFIQTDVAINPGNSGGPLFNLGGEVIGINSQIYSRTGGFMGLSFAIPIDMAMNVVEQLKTKGRVVRGWLGVLIQDVTRELAESFGMDKPKGALVAKVLPGSPAEQAGFELGDVVVRFNSQDVTTSSSLPPLVGITPVGRKIPVEVIRKGKKITLKVEIGELPNEEDIKVGAAEEPGKKSMDNKLNVRVEDIGGEQREEMGLGDKGVVVTDISGGPASRAGIRRGDVILMINNKDIKNVNIFNKIVKGLPKGKSVPVLVQRRGGPVFLALKVEDDN